MTLPKFLFVESPELPGAGFILASQDPCFMAKIIKFNTPEDLEIFNYRSIASFALVPGYMIAIQYFTIITAVQNKVLDKESVIQCLKQMATYYLENKIVPNKTYYKRNLL